MENAHPPIAKPDEAPEPLQDSAAKDLAARILRTPTEGEDLTKAYFPLSDEEE